MDNATQDVHNLENETEHLENVNNQIQNLSDEMQLKAYIKELEKQNKELNDKNADSNNKIQALTDDKTRLNDTVAKAKQSYAQLEQKFDQLDEQLTNAYKAKAECKADLDTIANQLQNKIYELQALRSSEVKALEGQIKELEDKLQQENVERAVIDNSYTAEKDKMVAEFGRTDLDPMRNEFNNFSIEKVNLENELKEEIAKLYEIKYKLEDDKNQLEQKLNKNEGEIKKLIAIKGNLQSALEQRNLQINQLKNELFTYEQNCLQHGEENKYLREKIDLLEKELNAKCNENRNLKNSLFAISSELEREREATKTKSLLITELYDKNRNLAKESAQNEWNARIIEKLNLEIKKMDKENAQVLNEILVGNTSENFKLSNEDFKATGTDEIISYPKTTPSLMKAHSSHNSRHITSQRQQSYSPEPHLNPPHNLHIGPKSFLPSVDYTRPLQKSPTNITGPLAHPISDHTLYKVYSPVQFYPQPYFTSPNSNPGLIPPQQAQSNAAAQHFGQQDQQAYDPNQYPTRVNNETEQASYLIHPQSYANDPTRQYATLPSLNDQTQCQTNYNPEQSTNYDQISQRQQNMQSEIDYRHKLTNPNSVCQICAKEFANESEMDNHIANCVTPLNLSKHPRDHRYYTMPQATSMDNLCSTKSVPSTRYSVGDSHMPTSRSNSEFAGNSCKFSESTEHAGVLESTYFNSSSTSESKVQVMLVWKKSVATAKREITYFDAINNDSISLKLDNENENFQTNLTLQPGPHKGSLSIEDIDYMLEVNEFEVSKLKSTSNTVQVIHLNTIAPGMLGWSKQDQFEGKKV